MMGLILFCECLVEKAFLQSLSFCKKLSKILDSIHKDSVFTMSLSMFLVLKCSAGKVCQLH